MTEPTPKELLDEAADLFLRLRQSPDDPTLLQQRDRFLARGAAEQAAYGQIADAWTVTGGKKRSKPILPLVLIGFLGLSLWSSAPDARVLWVADHMTARQPQEITLSSGDIAHLDAQTAIEDNSDEVRRDINLLRGAGYFEITPDSRPFSVTIGGLTVTALGTEFETAFIEDAIHVAVFEGRVSVSYENVAREVGAGAKLVWSATGGSAIAPATLHDIAPWRNDALVVDGMTFAEVAAILERRLRGSVRVIGQDLAKRQVTGRYDLSRPAQS